MSALQTLIALVGGASMPVGILGTCRLESGNVDAFGTEAVASAFRRAPITGAENYAVVAASGHLALFGENDAVVADLFGENIGRLWRIGQPEPGAPEPAVSVAFDTDLRQARADVFVAAAEHAALDPAAIGRIEGLGRALVDDASPEHAAFRARAFAVRAFGDAEQGCVLFAIHALAAPPIRTPSLTYAAARWNGETTQIVRDPVRSRAEHVRIAG